MFKKIIVVFFAVICLGFSYVSFPKPALSQFSDELTFYTNSFDSNSGIVKGNCNTYRFLTGVTGESCVVDTKDYSVPMIVSVFNASALWQEQLEDCKVYYFSSNLVKYSRTIEGREINLQIAEYEDRLVVGTPMIFGSF